MSGTVRGRTQTARELDASYASLRALERERLAVAARIERQWVHLGLALRRWREARGLSLREYARRKKVSAAYVCDAEYGRRNPVHLLPQAED